MTVPNSLNKHTYTGNSATTEFPYTFKIFATTDIQVILTDVATGANTILSSLSNYSVNTTTNVVKYPITGDPLTSATKITLSRQVPIKQEIELPNGGPYLARVVEGGFDRGIIISQQLQEQLSRTLSQSITADSDISNELPTPVALHSFRWDSTAKNLETTLDPASVLPAATAARDTAVASAAAASLSETAAASSASAAASSAALVEVVSVATPNKILRLDGSSKLPADTTGNSATATKLQTARNINGVAFDGTADINTTASSIEAIAGTDNTKTITPLRIRDAFNCTGTAPIYAGRTWVNFNGVPLTGTYAQSGTTVTVTMTAHGLTAGDNINLSITSGTGVSGTYTVATVTNANVFTYTAGTILTTSGNITRNIYIRGSGNVSSITDNGVGLYTINLITAISDTNASVVVSGTRDITNTLLTGPILGHLTSTTTVLCRTFDGANASIDWSVVSMAIIR